MASDNETVAENCSGRHDAETTFDDAIAAIGKNVNTSFQNCPTKDLDVVIMPIGGIWADIKAIEAAHRREVAELRECLEEAIDEKCSSCKSEWYGKCVTSDGGDCELISKWRKTLEGAEDEGK